MDKLMQRKSILIAVSLVVLSIVWFNFFYLSNAAKIQAAKTNSAHLNQEINSYRSLISNVGDVNDRVNLVRSELNQNLDEICSVDSIPDFIDKLRSSMEMYDFNNLTIKPKVSDLLENMQIPIGDKTFDLVEFEIKGIGRFISIGKYLEYLNSETYFNKTLALNISYNKSLNPKVLFSVKISTYIRMQG